jgi:hypothetical protein
MPKKPLSVTLDQDNLLWLRGRAASRKRKSLSDAIDEIITAARLGGVASDAPRSVVGTIDIAPDDPDLEKADAHVQSLFAASLARPVLGRETKASFGGRTRKPRRG